MIFVIKDGMHDGERDRNLSIFRRAGWLLTRSVIYLLLSKPGF